MRALVTRPEPDASAFAALCRENGIEPVMAPLMEIRIDRKTVALGGVAAVAFTSANGVRAFAANTPARALAAFAVGPATAAAARAAGFDLVHAAGGDVGSLVQLIGRHRGAFAGAVLHVAGTDRAGDLVGGLRAAGLPAERVVLYAARPAQSLPAAAAAALAEETPPAWAALFSPRTATLFASLVRGAGLEDRLRHVRAACLSDAVADAARVVSWKCVDVAASRHADSLINLMIRKDGAVRA